MIYILTCSLAGKNFPNGHISYLFEDAFTNARKAEKAFDRLILNKVYFRKELWVKETNGIRRLLKEKLFNG